MKDSILIHEIAQLELEFNSSIKVHELVSNFKLFSHKISKLQVLLHNKIQLEVLFLKLYFLSKLVLLYFVNLESDSREILSTLFLSHGKIKLDSYFIFHFFVCVF